LGGSITVKRIEDFSRNCSGFQENDPCCDDLDFKLPLLIAASSLAFQSQITILKSFLNLFLSVQFTEVILAINVNKLTNDPRGLVLLALQEIFVRLLNDPITENSCRLPDCLIEEPEFFGFFLPANEWSHRGFFVLDVQVLHFNVQTFMKDLMFALIRGTKIVTLAPVLDLSSYPAKVMERETSMNQLCIYAT